MVERSGALLQMGVVVIGRNEGERLGRCLRSVVDTVPQVVYVDSGSTDRSVEMAREMGVEVVGLDMRIPFTAARARNEGFHRLSAAKPGLTYVQFVDGDCEIVPGWLEKAVAFLDAHDDVAAVCGRRRERHPENSIYNMLCDIEWDTKVGEARYCGGDAMLRVDAFTKINGYRVDLITSEDPEICVRLRSAGWRIWRVGEEMTIHDAAMLRFGQWWKRELRTGYGFAEGARLHGAPPERHFARESRSAWLWGLGLPLGVSVLASWWGAWALAMFLIYPLQVVRLAMRGTRSARENWWCAAFLVLGKFPETLGQLKYMFHRYFGGQSRLIEYK